jgi:hypothetical protein
LTTIIKNSDLTAEIKHFGAELFSLKDNANKEYMWEGNPDFWGKHSPVLFPIVGTLKNNTYQYNNKEYHLSRHGFARDMEFQLAGKTENSATFSIHSNEETLKVYSFEFELQIIYTLENCSLIIEYKVINKTNSEMLFSIGNGIDNASRRNSFTMLRNGFTSINASANTGPNLPRAELDVKGTGAIIVPVGTSAQRPVTPVAGMIRMCSDCGRNGTAVLQGYDGNNWVDL